MPTFVSVCLWTIGGITSLISSAAAPASSGPHATSEQAELVDGRSADEMLRGRRRDEGCREELSLHTLRSALTVTEQMPRVLRSGIDDPQVSAKIPARIVQTLNRKSFVPPTIAAAFRTWQVYNGEYTFELHDEADMRRLIAEKFHDSFLQIMDSLGQYQQKSDLWRLCYLYLHGGVYVDADYAPTTPLRDFVPLDVAFVAAVSAPVAIDPMNPPVGCHTRADSMKRMQNGFLAAVAGHPVVLLALQRLRWNYFRKEDQHYLAAMGPALLYDAYATVFGDPLVDVIRGPGQHGILEGPGMEPFLGRAHRSDVLLMIDMGAQIWSLEKDGAQPLSRLIHKYPGWAEEIATMRNDNTSRISYGGTCLLKFR